MKYRKTNEYQICCFYCVIHNNVIFVWKVILQKYFSYMPTMNTSMHELPVECYTQEAQKIGRIPHLSVDTHGGNFKTTHVHLFPNSTQCCMSDHFNSNCN
jgi:hypothetical protein